MIVTVFMVPTVRRVAGTARAPDWHGPDVQMMRLFRTPAPRSSTVSACARPTPTSDLRWTNPLT
jgi:hypothetical protein